MTNRFENTFPEDREEIHHIFAKCFSTPEGAKVLSFLQKITLERYLGPDCSSEQLRHLEGQRHLVCYIKSLAEVV